MERDEVLYLIKYYTEIDKNLKFNNAIIKDYEDEYYSPTVTPSYTDGIHGKGDISTPVENMVLSIPENIQLYMNELKGHNSRLVAEKSEFWALISQLDYNPKNVIYLFYVKGYSWEKIARQLNYSQSHCRTMRDKAMAELGGILEGSEMMVKILARKK